MKKRRKRTTPSKAATAQPKAAGPIFPKPRYTVPETAILLGLSRAHVWNLIWSGKLPTVREGRRRFVTHQVVYDRAQTSHA